MLEQVDEASASLAQEKVHALVALAPCVTEHLHHVSDIFEFIESSSK